MWKKIIITLVIIFVSLSLEYLFNKEINSFSYWFHSGLIFMFINLAINYLNTQKYAFEMEDLIDKSYSITQEAYSQMKKLDNIGAFEADDEVGIIFKKIKEIIDNLNKFYQKISNE